MNSQVCARRERQNSGYVPTGPLWHPRSNASASGRKFLHRHLPSACSGNARARASIHKRLNAALAVTTFPFSDSTQAYAKSRGDNSGGHTVQPPNHFLSTFGSKSGIFMAVHPFPRSFVGLCGNFQLIELGKGEQPIGTQHLERFTFFLSPPESPTDSMFPSSPGQQKSAAFPARRSFAAQGFPLPTLREHGRHFFQEKNFSCFTQSVTRCLYMTPAELQPFLQSLCIFITVVVSFYRKILDKLKSVDVCARAFSALGFLQSLSPISRTSVFRVLRRRSLQARAA